MTADGSGVDEFDALWRSRLTELEIVEPRRVAYRDRTRRITFRLIAAGFVAGALYTVFGPPQLWLVAGYAVFSLAVAVLGERSAAAGQAIARPIKSRVVPVVAEQAGLSYDPGVLTHPPGAGGARRWLELGSTHQHYSDLFTGRLADGSAFSAYEGLTRRLLPPSLARRSHEWEIGFAGRLVSIPSGRCIAGTVILVPQAFSLVLDRRHDEHVTVRFPAPPGFDDKFEVRGSSEAETRDVVGLQLRVALAEAALVPALIWWEGETATLAVSADNAFEAADITEGVPVRENARRIHAEVRDLVAFAQRVGGLMRA